jgi:uncharacterized protein YukE
VQQLAGKFVSIQKPEFGYRAERGVFVSKAVVDPEELRRFAFDLKRFNTEVQAQVVSIQRRFSKLGETWRDQEHEKFADDFNKMMGVFTKFVDTSEKHIPFLLRKAQKAQEYLD